MTIFLKKKKICFADCCVASDPSNEKLKSRPCQQHFGSLRSHPIHSQTLPYVPFEPTHHQNHRRRGENRLGRSGLQPPPLHASKSCNLTKTSRCVEIFYYLITAKTKLNLVFLQGDRSFMVSVVHRKAVLLLADGVRKGERGAPPRPLPPRLSGLQQPASAGAPGLAQRHPRHCQVRRQGRGARLHSVWHVCRCFYQ